MDVNQQKAQLRKQATDLLSEIAINLSQLHDLVDGANNTGPLTRVDNVMQTCEEHAQAILDLPAPNPPPGDFEGDTHSITSEELNFVEYGGPSNSSLLKERKN